MYSVSWSVGEIAIETLRSDHHHLTQGFHQSWLTVTRIEKNLLENFSLSLYPNPVEHILFLEWKEVDEHPEMHYKIMNINGMELLNVHSSSVLFEIDMSSYPSGIYTLIVSDSKLKKKILIYKLIKI